jgi:hypothetical protein
MNLWIMPQSLEALNWTAGETSQRRRGAARPAVRLYSLLKASLEASQGIKASS